MAKLNKKGNLKGKIGNLIYREYGEQNIVQMHPGRVKQTANTQIAAKEFGLASNAAAIIRRTGRLIYAYSDGQVSSRLNVELLKCLHRVDKAPGERTISDIDPTPLTGFQFNLEAPFERCLKSPLYCSVEVDGTITLKQQGIIRDHISYFQTRRGSNTQEFLRITVVGIDYQKKDLQLIHQEECTLASYRNPTSDYPPLGETWQCQKQLKENQIVLVYGALHYYERDWLGRTKAVEDRKYNAAGILLAFKVDAQMYALNQQSTQRETYEVMDKQEEIYSIQDDMMKDIAKIKEKKNKK